MSMPQPDVLISVEEHLARILDAIKTAAPVDVPIADALGLVLAEDIDASAPLPGFDNSGMDGYAVVASDLDGASEDAPLTLPVLGDIAAGAASITSLEPGTAVRIMTGAPVPSGCTAVVPVEWTDSGVDRVQIYRQPVVGQHIRRRGEDVHTGDRLLSRGVRITAREIAAIVSDGRASIRAYPRPHVVVLSTGAELRAPGEALGHDSIYDSNSYMLAAQVQALGATVSRVGLVTDDAAEFTRRLGEHLVGADAVITSGGVSKGAYDVVKEALIEQVQFDTVAMQPGKPQGFGTINSVPIFTLPGNPVSAYISFEVFVLPALRKLMGSTTWSRPAHEALLTEPLRSAPGKRQFLRGRVCLEGEEPTVVPMGGPGSHLVAGLAAANALSVVADDVVGLDAGDQVPVLLLDENF